jgi:hypothetical protein
MASFKVGLGVFLVDPKSRFMSAVEEKKEKE